MIATYTIHHPWLKVLLKAIAIVCGCCFITVQIAAYTHIHEHTHGGNGAVAEQSKEQCDLCAAAHTQAVMNSVQPPQIVVVLSILPEPRCKVHTPIAAIVETISRGPPALAL